jgi:predicted dehydrogenase
MIEQKKLKIGIVGLGRMGLMHTAILNSLQNSEVQAVVDPAMFPSKPLHMLNPKIKVYKTINKMFQKENIDGVLIASPVGFHIDNALECLSNNIPFLVEKPLAVNAQQAKPLLSELEKKPVINMIGYMARKIDSFREGKNIINSALENYCSKGNCICIATIQKKERMEIRP